MLRYTISQQLIDMYNDNHIQVKNIIFDESTFSSKSIHKIVNIEQKKNPRISLEKVNLWRIV